MKTNFDEIYSEIVGQAEQQRALNFFEAQKKEPNRRVVLYGAGGNCQFALFVCTVFKNIHIDCICDRTQKGEYVQNVTGGWGESLSDNFSRALA